MFLSNEELQVVFSLRK